MGAETIERFYAAFARRDGDAPLAVPSKATPIAVVNRADLPWLLATRGEQGPVEPAVGATAEIVQELRERGASFAADLASAIALRDKAMVARTPGVGPKVAERIATELKDKAPKYADIDPAVARLAGSIEEKRAPRPVADAVSALVNLGYGQPQAAAAIAAASRSAGEAAETAQLIRLGLKELAK